MGSTSKISESGEAFPSGVTTILQFRKLYVLAILAAIESVRTPSATTLRTSDRI